MAVPKAVKRQAEEAQRLFEQRNGDPEPVVHTDPPPTDQTPEPPEVETDPPAAPVEAKPENWELRYRNYKAGTDETIHQLRQENAALRGEVASLKEQADAGKSQPGFLSDEELEEYGDLAGIIERVAKQMVERELAPTRQKVESIAERSAETERERFEDGLTKRVKDWRVDQRRPEVHRLAARSRRLQRSAAHHADSQRGSAARHRTCRRLFRCIQGAAGRHAAHPTRPQGKRVAGDSSRRQRTAGFQSEAHLLERRDQGAVRPETAGRLSRQGPGMACHRSRHFCGSG